MPRTTPSTGRPRTRREPTQPRALHTRELIFEAALRLLEAEGLAGFNTNRLAALSGFSVGTLYQYFDNKRDLLAALARHEIQASMDAARARARARAQPPRGTDPVPADPRARVQAAVKALLGVFGGRLAARRELLQAALASGETSLLEQPVRELAALLEEHRMRGGAHDGQRLNADEAHVLAQAMIGVVRATLLADPARLRRPAFERALVRLILGFFALPTARAARV